MTAIERLKKECSKDKAMLIDGLETQGELINALHLRLCKLERSWWKKLLRRN